MLAVDMNTSRTYLVLSSIRVSINNSDRPYFSILTTLSDTLTETWDDINLAPYTKPAIDRIFGFNFCPSKAPYGLLKNRRPNNLLVYGPPGTGKTHLARILAKETKTSMIHISAADVTSKWVGDSEKSIRALFNLARMLSPSVVFIDEADSLLASRSGNHEVWKRDMVNQFLQEIDGVSQQVSQPFVILATNHPELLDHAVLRRFMSRLYLGHPSRDSRHRMLANLLKDEQTGADFDLGDLADVTRRYTGSDLRSLCLQAAQISEAESRAKVGHSSDTVRRVIDRSHFQRALSTIHPSVAESAFTQLRKFAREFDPSGEQAISEEALELFQKQPANTKSSTLPEVSRTTQHTETPFYSELNTHPKRMTIKSVSTMQLDKLSHESPSDSVSRPAFTTAASHPGKRQCPSPTEQPQPKKMATSHSVHQNPEHNESEKTTAAHSESTKSTFDSHRRFKYQALQPGHNIRLLEVLDDGSTGGKIECTLHNTSLMKTSLFTALSYVWDTPALPEDVLLDGIPVRITGSLAYALRWVKHHWRHSFPNRDIKEFRIWVDAICINQYDLKERNHQVGLMRDIYSQAELVLSSISVADEEIQLALQTYNEIYRVLTRSEPRISFTEISTRSWLRRVPTLCSEDDDVKAFPRNRAWQALNKFGMLLYWKRIWILQETVLAKNLVLLCSSHFSKFANVSEISQILSLQNIEPGNFFDEHNVPDGMALDAWCPHCYRSLANFDPSDNSLGIRGIIKIKHSMRQDLLITQQLSSFAMLYEAKDPKDLIYGLLSLGTLNIDIDYTKSKFEVYQDFIRAYSQKTKLPCGHPAMRIDFMTFSRGYQMSDSSAPSWPSWLPDFSTQFPSQLSQGGKETVLFRNPENVLGGPSLLEVGETTLIAGGARIVSIAKASELHSPLHKSQNGFGMAIHFADFLRDMVVRHAPDNEPVLQRLIRVLMANSEPMSTEMITFAFAIFLRWVFSAREDATWRTLLRAMTLTLQSPFDDTDLTEIREWFLRNFAPEHVHLYNYDQLQEVSVNFLSDASPAANPLRQIRNKVDLALLDSPFSIAARPGNIIFETSCGCIGLTPGCTTVGDVICLLEGIRQVVILRQMDDHFVFIGCCFILGLEEDELKRRLDVGEMEIERFEIR